MGIATVNRYMVGGSTGLASEGVRNRRPFELPVIAEYLNKVVFEPFKRWRLVRQTVAELSRLSDHQLHDIGILRVDITQVADGLVKR